MIRFIVAISPTQENNTTQLEEAHRLFRILPERREDVVNIVVSSETAKKYLVSEKKIPSHFIYISEKPSPESAVEVIGIYEETNSLKTKEIIYIS